MSSTETFAEFEFPFSLKIYPKNISTEFDILFYSNIRKYKTF